MSNAKYLGLTANKLANIASELDAEKEALCTRIDKLCEENEKLRELCRSIYINYAKDCMPELRILIEYSNIMRELGVTL